MSDAAPHSLESEETVIGGILVDPRAYHEVSDLLPDDFYLPALSSAFSAMSELAEKSHPIDATSVLEQMRAAGTDDRLTHLGGAEYLTLLMVRYVVSNVAFHARAVKRKAERRRWAATLRELAAKGYAGGDDSAFLEEAEARMLELSMRQPARGPREFKAVLRDSLRTLEKRAEKKEAVTGVPTGFSDLDEMTAGLQPGELTVIAARPAMGKTSFVMNAVVNAAVIKKIPSLVFSAEMSDESLAERSLASESRVDSTALRTGRLATRDWVVLQKAASRIAEIPVMLDDTSSPTIAYIRSTARRWRMTSAKGADLALVVVDYLQLITVPFRKGRQRVEEVAEISKGLKSLAKDLKCPVVALSQLNRSLESRADKRPMLSDLRESGAIEQDADVVAFIYRDEVYSKDECRPEDKGVAEIIVGKNRNGATGTARLAWLDVYTRFENLARGGYSQ